ncbi:hypothetical protein FOZ61_008912 [Perkinsus olseni]|uniref:CCHC-type domain-containing protein n=2 Tax=Perkinsus olseni TaxID=32597 RepID=A0A7J6L2Z0_PEROL|nr:hypothetical protein FOZ61_008912 [Perkinsus olseni]
MCVQAVEGSASPLCILLYAATLPRYVVAQLKEMLVEEVRCADDHNKVNTDSPLLNWQKVQDPTDNDDVNEEYLKTIQELYTGWISCCDKIVDKVEKLMLEDDSRREGSNPVVLLRRWCNIPSRGGKMELGKIIEEESYLHGRLSTVCTGHVTISWKARIELYKLTLQNYPRFREKDTAFACFVGSLSDVSANIKDTQDLARAVQRLADSSGCSTVDEYLGFTQAEDTHGAGKKRGLSSPSSDEHRSHTDGKRQRFEQSKAPQKELASAKLGLPAEVVKSRFEAGVCLGCGQSGHRVRDCKNPVRGSSGVTVSSASAYSDRGVALMSLSASSMSALLTAPVKLINTNSSSEQYIAALAGFDTMSSVNLIDSDVTTRVECELVSETNTVRTIQGNVTAIARTLSLVRAIIARTRLRVCLGGYSADLSFAVVENLPAVQVLIGRPWLSELGVNVSLPEFATTTTPRGDIFSTLSSQIQGAREALIGRLDKPQRLPGANRYYGRIRRLRAPGSSEEPDHPDHPDQTMAYEVWWDSAVSHKNSQRPERPSVPVDFSVPLINKLTEAQQAQFRSELQTFIDNGWWKEVPVRGVKAEWEQSQLCDEPLSPLRHPAVSFPIIQKAHKSTRCRLVTDCRYCNTFLPPASYEGWGVTDCIAYIRANWKDSFSLAFLDLSKAFYKVHLGEGARLLILSDGRAFECGRLAFGLTHGPASLAGQVRELLNASLTGLLGRPVHCTSTREYVSLVPGLMILPYYDDIILCGLPNLCHRMASIMTSIAPLLGANFPREKTDWVEPSGDAVRHLGCLWSRSEDGGLCIQCLPPDEDRSSVSSPVSRRRIFQIAGALYDGVRLHPITRYVADKLRRWGGRSPYGNTRKGWDSQWAISDSCRENLNKLIAAGQSDDFGNCRHSSVPTHHRYILGFCDASESGWAFLVYTGSAIPKGSAPDLSASNPAFHLLEAHAGEWSDSNASSKWHINRKEAHTLSRCLQCVYDWLGRFLDPRDRFDTAVFCDNISALSWALETSKPSRSYDRTALERLSRSLNDLREQISRDYRLPIDLRPECQGLVERTIGEIKKICRLSHRLPLWAAAQVAVTVHNNALISGNAACTPNELALGLACPLDLPITENDGGSSTLSIAAGLHDYVSEAYSAFALRRSEEAFNAELRSVASTSPRFSFEPGDLVKLSRLVNGKREISGPFTVARRDPSNSFLYHLVDRSDPVSVSQLLPYHDVAERETYDFAIKPTQDRLSFSVKGKLPDGVELDELQKNKHWLLYRVEAAIEGDELTTKVYVAKFMRKMDDNDKFLVQGLDRQADGSFKLPPTRDRKRTQAVVSSEDILGGRGFLPTRGGWRIPRSVKAWFSDYGIDLAGYVLVQPVRQKGRVTLLGLCLPGAGSVQCTGRRDATRNREFGDVLVWIPGPPRIRSGGPPEVRVRDESEAACHRSKTQGASRPLGARPREPQIHVRPVT